MAGLSEAELQVQYDKAKKLMDSVECLVKNSDKAKTYKSAAKKFEALGDFKDSSDMAAKCKKEAESCLGKKDNLPEAPKNPMDLKKPSKAATWILRAVVLLVIIGVIGLFYTRTTDHGAYLRSSFYEGIGNHEKAYKMFLHLKGYKDSEKRYLKNRYKHGLKMLEENHLWKARDAFRDIRDYKDAGDKLAKAEIEIIKKTKKNGDVLFGEAHWLVVEKQDDKAFLVRTKPYNGIAYNDKDTSVTWEDSFIRLYLNTTFMAETFTPAMIDKILVTNVTVKGNKKFGTKGCKTKDRIYMLNDKQAEKYSKPLSVFLRDYWLIGPGETQREAQFVSFGQVKKAGYPVTDKDINTRPCMWVSLK